MLDEINLSSDCSKRALCVYGYEMAGSFFWQVLI